MFTELGDISRIDLILEANKLYRIQVKSVYTVNGVAPLYLRKSGPNYSYVYTLEDIDIFAVYVMDRDMCLYISAEEALDNGKKVNFRIDPTKNNQEYFVRWAKDYTDIDKIIGR